MLTKFRIVCATRVTREQFQTQTALGRSLALYRYGEVELRLFPENTGGLPAVYNTAIREAASAPGIIVFVHDDVHLCDFFWPRRLLEALRQFDIVGVAGNRRMVAGQPAWHLTRDPKGEWVWDSRENLSGMIGHGSGFPPQGLVYYGEPHREMKLLDGVFLAARVERLTERGVMFDERFSFHFYDLDFCRQAQLAGLRLGTCALSLVHESGGQSISGSDWQAAYAKYLEKWRG